jgi:signal transduction histidine kinase/integral membrane sensor domain MASE1/CheY-like chemotaxis protein
MSRPPRRALGTAAVIGGVALAYFAAARLGLSLAFVAEQVSVIWPPTGIAITALVVFRRRAAAGVFAGAFVANATVGEPLAAAAGIAAGNTLGALLGFFLLRKAGFSRHLERIWDVFALLGLAGAVASAASATLGVSTLCLTGLHPWAAFRSLWWVWWLGDLMGVVLIAPVLLTLPARTRWPAVNAGEAALLFTLLSVVTLVVFAGRVPTVPGASQLAYAVFPIVIWAALRFRQRETAAAIALIAGIAVWGTFRGYGPFVGRDLHHSLVLLQIFMAVIAGTGLVLAAAIAERRTAERRRAADYSVAQLLAESATLEAAAPRILRTVCECLEWDVGAIWTVDERERLVCREVWHGPRVSAPRFVQATRERSFEIGVGLPGRVWQTGEPRWIADVVWDANFPRAPVAAAEGLHAGFGFPIRLGAEVLGVVEFFSSEIRQPDADLLRMFATMGAQIGHFLERRRVEAERTHLLAELRRASQAKDEFLAVLGHELRNPLAPLRSALEVLRARGWPDQVAQRMGEVMDRQLRHMVRLVDDLLDVSRITRGRIELRRERVDLGEVAARVAEAVRPLVEERGLQLAVSRPDEPLAVHADATRLDQVAANLLHNAARYTGPGGRIAVRVFPQAEQAVLRVEDTGIGIPPEMLERIFEPFVQAPRPSQAGAQPSAQGLGIGLTLVRSLVEMHEGSVRAHSPGPGHGSTFEVRLPRAAEAAAETARGGKAGASVPPAAVRARRVLLLDDNVDGAESLALVLRQRGHEVVAVHDGRAALAEAGRAAFDVGLLDIGLPDGMDGYEVARRLRALEAGPRVLIALTGFGQEEDQRRSREAGFSHHLVKPVDPRELEQLLAAL